MEVYQCVTDNKKEKQVYFLVSLFCCAYLPSVTIVLRYPPRGVALCYCLQNVVSHLVHAHSGMVSLIVQPPSTTSPRSACSNSSLEGMPYTMFTTLPPHFGHFSGLLATFIVFVIV